MDTTVVVIGAGQAGLAMSRCLTEASIDHVILERGTVANSWRTERWDSLRLLTPNWRHAAPRRRRDGTARCVPARPGLPSPPEVDVPRGVGDDARDLTAHLVGHLERTAVRAR